MKKENLFSNGSHIPEVLYSWWTGLKDDRATRAILKRCATLDEVVLSDAYQRFYRYMLRSNWPEDAAAWQLDKLALIAGLLAHVKEDDPNINIPVGMSKSEDGRPPVSEMRFSDLLKVETTEDLYISLRRVLPLMKHKINIRQLANDMYWWDEKTKKQWAYGYIWPAK